MGNNISNLSAFDIPRPEDFGCCKGIDSESAAETVFVQADTALSGPSEGKGGSWKLPRPSPLASNQGTSTDTESSISDAASTATTIAPHVTMRPDGRQQVQVDCVISGNTVIRIKFNNEEDTSQTASSVSAKGATAANSHSMPQMPASVVAAFGPEKEANSGAITQCPVVGKTQSHLCPLKHGTVYASPYPGYVHGRNPAICKYGCKPAMIPHGEETPRAKMLREALEFQELFHFEKKSPLGELQKRYAAIEKEVAKTGTYTHTCAELQAGAAIAWRNASKCANRKFWNTIEAYDRRDVRKNQGMFDACIDHLSQVAKEGVTKVRMTVFPAADPETGKGPRFWSEQLTRFAAFYDGDKIVGDPANLAFTDMLKMHFKWTPKDKSPFQPLPIVIQAANREPELFELPESCSIMVDIWHPNYPFLADLEMKWTGVPALLGFVMELGGLSYPAIPFNGWFADTEIMRDLADADRYNMLPVIAKGLGLSTENDSNLWKDEALLVLSQAIMHSYKHADVAMVDHHTMLAAFWKWYHDEMRVRGFCPGNWKWIIPPVAGATCEAYMGLNKMTDYTLKPLYKNGPGWRKYVVSEFGLPDAEAGMQKLGVAVRVVWAAAKMLHKTKQARGKVLLVYASSNGSTKTFAESAGASLRSHCNVTLMDAASIQPLDHKLFDWQLQLCDTFVLFTASYGRGDPPEEASGLYKYLQSSEFDDHSMKSKPYAVLGFGNSDFPDFCGAATKFDKVLSSLGGKQLCPVGRVDELNGRQATFDKWIATMVPKLTQFSRSASRKPTHGEGRRASKGKGDSKHASDEAFPMIELDFAENDERPVDRLLEKETLEDHVVHEHAKHKSARDFFFDASVVSIDTLEGKAGSTTEPGLVLTRLALRDGIPFKAGDHLAVVPTGRQFEEKVEGICQALNVDANTVFVAKPSNGRSVEKHVSPLLHMIQFQYTTMRTVLCTVANLGEQISGAACGMLAGFADDEQEASLLQLASSESDFHARMCQDGGMRWVDLFDSFRSLVERIPLEIFLVLLPTHNPKMYTIASSPAVSSQHVDLIVPRCFTWERNECREGMATDDLAILPSGTKVQFQVRTHRDFHLPGDSRAPLVMVGAGAGLSPFRAFLQERAIAGQKGQKLGPAVLIYGSNEEIGSLLAKELAMAQACGALTLMITSVSSCQSRKKVSDEIVANQAALQSFLKHTKCEVYLCGSASMVTASRSALTGGDDEQFQKLQSEGRWHEDFISNEGI